MNPKNIITFGTFTGTPFEDIPVWYLSWLNNRDFVQTDHPKLYEFLNRKEIKRQIGEYYAMKYKDMYGEIDPYSFCD